MQHSLFNIMLSQPGSVLPINEWCNQKHGRRCVSTWVHHIRQLQGSDSRTLPTRLLTHTWIVCFPPAHSKSYIWTDAPILCAVPLLVGFFCIAPATVLLVSCLFNALSRRYRYVRHLLQFLRKFWMMWSAEPSSFHDFSVSQHGSL